MFIFIFLSMLKRSTKKKFPNKKKVIIHINCVLHWFDEQTFDLHVSLLNGTNGFLKLFSYPAI